MNYDNIYKTEVEPSEQQKVKGGLPRLSSAFISRLFSKRSIAREGTLNLPLKVIGNNKSFASQ